MNPTSPYLVLPIILVALATMKLSAKILGIRPAEGRFAPIDGLRGYMAFLVFIYHSSIWYFFLHGYGWAPPPSYLFRHFGPTSVAVFFMITSFLFFSKLLNAREGKVDWLKLYVGRAMRIMPLYGVAMLVLVYIVGLLSHFTLREPLGNVLLEILEWVAFIKVNINGVVPTWLIVAGVIWSLPYEWLFYFLLPFLGLFVKIRPSPLVLIFSLLGSIFFLWVIWTFYASEGLQWINPFFFGIIAAFLARNEKARELATGTMASICITVFLVLIVSLFPTVSEPIPLLLLGGAFIGIACGNNLFGILTHSLSRTLGQISYSIYLLHGIVLFVTFQWILGSKTAASFSPLEHWGVIGACSIVVVSICSVTYRFIERPALEAAPSVAERWKRYLFLNRSGRWI